MGLWCLENAWGVVDYVGLRAVPPRCVVMGNVIASVARLLISYVNRFVRGLRLRRWLRFSSTVVRRIEIAVFVAKQGPVASDFEAISSP